MTMGMQLEPFGREHLYDMARRGFDCAKLRIAEMHLDDFKLSSGKLTAKDEEELRVVAKINARGAYMLAAYLDAIALSKGATSEEATAALQDASAGGLPIAMARLAGCYLHGRGVPVDVARGLELLKRAAAAGYAEAKGDLGLISYFGHFGQQAEPARATSSLQAAASAGCGRAAYAVAKAVWDKSAGERSKALAAMTQAATLGHVPALVFVGHAQENGVCCDPNADAAHSWYTRAADAGDPTAEKNCAIWMLHNRRSMLEDGMSDEAINRKIVLLLQRAASVNRGPCVFSSVLGAPFFREEPDATAAWMLGCFYATGMFDVVKNASEAARLFKLAAELGHQDATVDHALCLLWGRGVAPNAPKALQILEGVAESGFPRGITALAGVHLFGLLGQARSPERAEQLLQEAAMRNYPPASTALGMIFEQGLGVRLNHHAAFGFFERGDQDQEPISTFHLARCYISGRGVPRDIQRGKRMLARLGDVAPDGQRWVQFDTATKRSELLKLLLLC